MTGKHIASVWCGQLTIALAFSPDGEILAVAIPPGNGRIEFLGYGCRKLCAPLRETSGVDTLAFSPDGKTLASGASLEKALTEKTPWRLWEVDCRKPTAALEGRGSVTSVASSRDGKLLIGRLGDDA